MLQTRHAVWDSTTRKGARPSEARLSVGAGARGQGPGGHGQMQAHAGGMCLRVQ